MNLAMRNVVYWSYSSDLLYKKIVHGFISGHSAPKSVIAMATVVLLPTVLLLQCLQVIRSQCTLLTF